MGGGRKKRRSNVPRFASEIEKGVRVGVGLPIMLSACEVKVVSVYVCASEVSFQKGSEGVGVWWADLDKGLCSHECHTNKVQSDIEVQPVR